MDAVKVKAELRKRFDGLNLEQKRSLIRGLLEVTIYGDAPVAVADLAKAMGKRRVSICLWPGTK